MNATVFRNILFSIQFQVIFINIHNKKNCWQSSTLFYKITIKITYGIMSYFVIENIKKLLQSGWRVYVGPSFALQSLTIPLKSTKSVIWRISKGKKKNNNSKHNTKQVKQIQVDLLEFGRTILIFCEMQLQE